MGMSVRGFGGGVPAGAAAELGSGADYSRAAAAKMGIFAALASSLVPRAKNLGLMGSRQETKESLARVGQLETLLAQTKALLQKDTSADNDAFVEVLEQDLAPSLAQIRTWLEGTDGGSYNKEYIMEAFGLLAESARAVESDLRGGCR